jgi:predicted TIM-barrel fold metal-dependent hydrolase
MKSAVRCSARWVLCLAVIATVATMGCRQPPAGTSSGGSSGKMSMQTRTQIASLEAELAATKKQLRDQAGGPVGMLPAINTHEHLLYERHAPSYLEAAKRLGIERTIIVSSPIFTLFGKGEKGQPSMQKNWEEVIKVAKAYPHFIPFTTIDPKDPEKLDRLKRHVEQGAKGVKIYSGHSNLYDGPLDAADMMPIYAWLEETKLPVNWHINLAKSKFMDEFQKVMDKHPKLNVMVPHYGVGFWNPPRDMPRITAMMRKYPSVYVDTSLGTREILINGMYRIAEGDNMQLFKQFFDEFQDRIVYGSDSVITGNKEKTPSWYSHVIIATRDHLEKESFTFPLAEAYAKYWKKGRDPSGRIQGMGIPQPIAKKVYKDNAVRWLGDYGK